MGLWSASQNILSNKALLMKFILAFIHSLSKSLFSAYYMPGTSLGIGNKVQTHIFPHRAYFYSERTASVFLSVV